MCTTPNETCLRSFFLNVFFLPFFSGAAAPPAAAGFAMKSSLVLSRSSLVVRRSQNPYCRAFAALVLANDQRPATPLRFRRRFPLLRDGSFARTFTGTGIGVGALSADRQVAAVAESAIGADLDEPLNAHRNLLAQVAFHQAFAFDNLADAVHLVFSQILDLLHRVHFGLIENASRPRLPDAINVSERDKRPFVARKIDACDACHSAPIILAAACVSKSSRSPAPHLCGG